MFLRGREFLICLGYDTFARLGNRRGLGNGVHIVASSGPGPRDGVVVYNARLGVVLFFFYLLLYVGFIYLNAFDRERMAADAVGGVNLAVIYGFGLIVAAFVLAIVYMILCRHSASTGGSR
jgi:uncharacterized membrane protein (DUF485 family)